MKYKKKLITLFMIIASLTGFNSLYSVLTMSQYKPDSYFQKPYFTQDYFTDISCIFSGGFANSAYNNNNNKVAFLQQFGTEDLLKKFVDTTLPSNNIESFGQGLLSGNFHLREIILSSYKNIVRGFFIEGSTAIQDLSINNIDVNFVQTAVPLSQEQLIYLERLQQKLPKSMNQAGMFTTAFYAGYHATYSNFTHLDFIDFQIKTGMMSPQAMYDTNQSLVQFPFIQNINFGYPVIATATIGILDWMTIGCNGAVIPWQKAMGTIPMNNSFSQNNLLMPESGVAFLQRGPLFSTSIYFEADHIHQGYSTIIAYCYTRNCSYTITPIDTINIQKALVNESQLLNAWSLGSVYVQFDIDFACETTPSAPVLSVFCHIPVAGQLCTETNIFGGSCSLQVSYAF
ncbi:hypothetical protein KBC04_05635 [Candidatus Babeliales bacterium]|nr:hypothetical protein [Candidatus Babeliales bacterium]MBP9843844.1 hypothetical protein [Candidatus Babeliales bacterium]